MSIDINDFCNVEEAARIIGCTDGRVRQLLRAGRSLKGRKFNGRAWLVEQQSAENYAALQQKTGRPKNSS